MKTKKEELKFIEAHQGAFNAALAKATISVRSNCAFVGLNKIREPLAYQAALKAIGYPGIAGFMVLSEKRHEREGD